MEAARNPFFSFKTFFSVRSFTEGKLNDPLVPSFIPFASQDSSSTIPLLSRAYINFI